MNSMNSLGLGSPYYWEAKYNAELDDIIGEVECFDWYLAFDQAWTMIESFVDLSINHRILIVGCGISNTVEVLYERGFRDITAIDISPTAITQNAEKIQETYWCGVPLHGCSRNANPVGQHVHNGDRQGIS